MNDFKQYRGRGRGQFPHNNFRGNVFNNVRRTNPNVYSPLLPLPSFRENKHRWARPQHNPMWQRPPRIPPFLRPPSQLIPPYIQDTKPPSPLPGSEEARQKAIAEASARIKQQLNLNENDSSGVTSEQIPSPNYTSFSDNKFDEIEEIPNSKPEKNLRKRNRRSTESTHTVEELRNKILTQFTSMSKGKIQNLVNNPGSSKYDNYLHHLVRDMRLHLSSELRNMYNNRENDSENNEMIDHFNSIVPDLGVELVNLPDTMVAELSKILQFDINNEISSSPIHEQNHEPLVEPEHMFKQAEKLLLNTDYLNTNFEMCDVSQISDKFSPDSTANLTQNNSFMVQNSVCNNPPANTYTCCSDVLETTDMDIENVGDNFTTSNQMLSSQDSCSNLDEIPLPDSNQQLPSQASPHFCTKTLDPNLLPDSTNNIIDENRTTITCIPSQSSSPFSGKSEINMNSEKNIETQEFKTIWSFTPQQQQQNVFIDVPKTLCDSTRNESITQHTNNTVENDKVNIKLNESFPCIKPEPDTDLDFDETLKQNRLPLDERIKMMMKMQESNPRKQQEDKGELYKNKNQKRKTLQKQDNTNNKIQVENLKNTSTDCHLNVIVKQEIFDEEEIKSNDTNNINTFIKRVKEFNKKLNHTNLMPVNENPTSENTNIDKDKCENLIENADISGSTETEETPTNQLLENEIPVKIDNTSDSTTSITDKIEGNSQHVDTKQYEIQTTPTVNKESIETLNGNREKIYEVQDKTRNEINELQSEIVNVVLNENRKIQENSVEEIHDQNYEDKNVLNVNQQQQTCLKENIEKREISINKVDVNKIDKQKEEIDVRNTEKYKLKEADEKLNTNRQNEKKNIEENNEVTNQTTTNEQVCNIVHNVNTEKLEIYDKVIKDNSIADNKIEKETNTQMKVEKEISRKHKSEDKKHDKSLEKDHKKSDRGNSTERRVSDKHYRHKSKEKHRDSKETDSYKYKSRSKSKLEQKNSEKSPKKTDNKKEYKIDLDITGNNDTSKMFNRLMEIDLQIQKLMHEKFCIYQKLNFTQHVNIVIPEVQQTLRIDTCTNSQRITEESEQQKDTEKCNKNKSSPELETSKEFRKRKRSPTPHRSSEIEEKKNNEAEVKIEPEKLIKKKGKFDKKTETKTLKKSLNKDTVEETDTTIKEIIIDKSLISDKDIKKTSKNEKKDKKKITENPSTNILDESIEECVEKVENKVPKKRKTKVSHLLNENIIDVPNKKILLKIKKPIKKISKKQVEESEIQEKRLEIVELGTVVGNEYQENVEVENKMECTSDIKEKKSKKKRKGEITNNNIEENKIKTETTNNNREENNESTEEKVKETYNNNNENTEYKIKLKVSEPSSDNKSIRLKIIKSEIKKEDSESDKLYTLRRSRRNTSEEIQNMEKIIRPSSLPKKKRKTDEENRRSRSRSMSKDPEKNQKKCESSDEDEPLGKHVKRRPFSGSDSESSCIDEKRVDKKINAKRKTRRLSRDSDISVTESIKSNKSVPENNSFINCFVKLERCDINTNPGTPEDTGTCTSTNTHLTTSDTTEDVDKDIHDIIANLDNNFEDSVGELEEFNMNTENNKPELEIRCSDVIPTGIFCSGHQKSILDIKILGDEFLAASEDGTIYKYCLKTGELQDAYTGHKLAVTCIYLMSGNVLDISSTLLYSGSLDCTLRCFNLDTAEILHSVAVEQAIQCMDSAWGHIFLGTYEGLLFIYNIKKKLLNDQSLTIANATVLMIKATTEGSRQVLILASRKREIMVRDAFTGLLLRTMCQDQKPTIYSLLLDKSMVYCGTSDKGILVLDFNNGTQTGLYNSGKGVVCMVMYKNLLFAGCYDGMIYVYNTKTQKHLSSISGPGDGMLLSLAISHDMIIAGTKKDYLLKIWKIPQEILNQIHH